MNFSYTCILIFLLIGPFTKTAFDCALAFRPHAIIATKSNTHFNKQAKADTSIIDSNQVMSEKVFQKVEVEASFSGDWINFLSRNLNADVPVKRKAPAGKYLVVVQFIVDKDGSINQLTPLTNLGFGMEDEVMRVIKKSPKWHPAMQDGQPVKAYRKQPITFVVSGKK